MTGAVAEAEEVLVPTVLLSVVGGGGVSSSTESLLARGLSLYDVTLLDLKNTEKIGYVVITANKSIFKRKVLVRVIED